MSSLINAFELEVRKERLHEVRDVVVSWYEKNCLKNEIEFFDYDLTKKEDRLKIFILGVFFNCVFQEKKALDIFKRMEKCGYLEFNELNRFEKNLKETLRILKQKTGRSYKILKVQEIIDSVNVLKQLFSEENDMIGVFNEKEDVEDFIKFLYSKLPGIKVKIFWICRECRNLFKIPEKYCYVPDSHVRKFLCNIGFLKKKRTYSLEEYIEISKNMARFLKNKYFDLPFMRYHQKNCSKCETGKKVKCKLECKFTTDRNQMELTTY